MESITRANPYLGEIIEILDHHFVQCNGDAGLARDRLSKSENEWIDEEIVHCMVDVRYFISNYYAYRDEKEGFRGLYPLWDSQEILHDEYRRLEGLYGKVRALVLKARQMGSTTYNCAEFFAKTIFAEHTLSLIVAQDEDQTQYIMNMYESAYDFLPWWMKPRRGAYTTGYELEFDDKDPTLRSLRPGLKSKVMARQSSKPTGVGRGKTFRRTLFSELAFWENGSQLSKALFPTMNAPDGHYIMESTANGRNDHWHNLWRRAEAGKIDWNPIFIPFYRREITYSLPIPKGEVFIRTKEEVEFCERILKKDDFIIKDETLNWARAKKEEYIATDGDDTMFSQEYTSEPEESFQQSAITAFPRGIIRKYTRLAVNPNWIGEIRFDRKSGEPKPTLRAITDKYDLQYPEDNDRFHVWKMPERGCRYVVGGDVSLGNQGGDYSCLQVLRLSDFVGEKDEQVACWHGLINPRALAGIACAIGHMYNEALVAIEVNGVGISTNNTLMRGYEYDNIYRYKRLDRLTNFITNITGFLSTPSSTDNLMSSMSTAFLEDEIIINCKYTMDEFNDYTEEGAQGDGAHDDYVDALMIALYCGNEGEMKARRDEKQTKVSDERNQFHVKDRFGTIILTTNSQGEAERASKKHIGSYIERTSANYANIMLAGRKRQVPADYANTDHSPIHDKQGTAHRLHYEEDIPAEEITLEMIAEFEAEEEMEEVDPDGWRFV